MKDKNPSSIQFSNARFPMVTSRRRFVQGLISGGVFGSAFTSMNVSGQESVTSANRREELKGKVFNLVIEERMVNFTGARER